MIGCFMLARENHRGGGMGGGGVLTPPGVPHLLAFPVEAPFCMYGTHSAG